MKILYLSNAIPDMVIKHAGLGAGIIGGGWVESLINAVMNIGEFETAVGFPSTKKYSSLSGQINKLYYFSFQHNNKVTTRDKAQIEYFKKIIEKFNPDIVHIFGTEYPHSLAMVQACKEKNIRVLVSIQGLLQPCADAYLLGVSCAWKKSGLPYSNRMQYYKNQMSRRAVYERAVLEQVGFVTGRTQWDFACTKKTNSFLQYLFCNEILRDSFYNSELWNPEGCVTHRIFFSQGSYPIKGIHVLLRNLKPLIDCYPDLTIHIGGYPPMELQQPKTIAKKIQRCFQSILLNTKLVRNYGSYVQSLIQQYNLEKHVHFCGPLSAEQMKQEYLQANVFVSTSSIENSPNSLGEAMMLGVPIVSSYVGGIMDMLQHGQEGFLFPLSEEYMLTHYIKRFFDEQNLCVAFGKKANEKAKKLYDKKANAATMINHYKTILSFSQ